MHGTAEDACEARAAESPVERPERLAGRIAERPAPNGVAMRIVSAG